jgi:BRCA1-associated protein
LPSLASSAATYYNQVPGNDARPGGEGPNAAASLNQEKIEAIGVEYTHLLTSQLDSQRAYYEERVCVVREQLALTESRLTSLEGTTVAREQLAAAESKVAEFESQKAELERVHEKDRRRLEQKMDRAVSLARRLEKDLAAEKEVSKGLFDNVKQMKEENAKRAEETAEMRIQVRSPLPLSLLLALEADIRYVVRATRELTGTVFFFWFSKQVVELQEQLRDLMFALSARDKIETESGAAELAGGDIVVMPPPPPATPSSRRRKKR